MTNHKTFTIRFLTEIEAATPRAAVRELLTRLAHGDCCAFEVAEENLDSLDNGEDDEIVYSDDLGE